MGNHTQCCLVTFLDAPNSNCCRGESIIPAPAIRSCASEERKAQVSAAVYKKGRLKREQKYEPRHELFIPPLSLQGRSVGSDEEPRGFPKSCAWLGWNFLEINGNLIKLSGVEMEERPRKGGGAALTGQTDAVYVWANLETVIK